MLKDIAGKLAAFGQALGGSVMSEEVTKGAMSGCVFESLEIASYTVLIATAKAAGDHQGQRVCETILPQEEAMAEWIKNHLPEFNGAFLTRSQAPDTQAKR